MNQAVDGIKTQLGVLATDLLDTLAALWNTAEEIDIDPETKAISRLVAGWATNELPMQIQDPTNDVLINRQLKIFQRSLRSLMHEDLLR